MKHSISPLLWLSECAFFVCPGVCGFEFPFWHPASMRKHKYQSAWQMPALGCNLPVINTGMECISRSQVTHSWWRSGVLMQILFCKIKSTQQGVDAAFLLRDFWSCTIDSKPDCSVQSEHDLRARIASWQHMQKVSLSRAQCIPCSLWRICEICSSPLV